MLSGIMWRHRTGSTLAKVMVYCLTAPNHGLSHFLSINHMTTNIKIKFMISLSISLQVLAVTLIQIKYHIPSHDPYILFQDIINSSVKSNTLFDTTDHTAMILWIGQRLCKCYIKSIVADMSILQKYIGNNLSVNMSGNMYHSTHGDNLCPFF